MAIHVEGRNANSTESVHDSNGEFDFWTLDYWAYRFAGECCSNFGELLLFANGKMRYSKTIHRLQTDDSAAILCSISADVHHQNRLIVACVTGHGDKTRKATTLNALIAKMRKGSNLPTAADVIIAFGQWAKPDGYDGEESGDSVMSVFVAAQRTPVVSLAGACRTDYDPESGLETKTCPITTTVATR